MAFTLAHLVCTALRALSLRCSALILAARVCPPSAPPFFPILTKYSRISGGSSFFGILLLYVPPVRSRKRFPLDIRRGSTYNSTMKHEAPIRAGTAARASAFLPACSSAEPCALENTVTGKPGDHESSGLLSRWSGVRILSRPPLQLRPADGWSHQQGVASGLCQRQGCPASISTGFC